jgi:hypothetical protein
VLLTPSDLPETQDQPNKAEEAKQREEEDTGANNGSGIGEQQKNRKPASETLGLAELRYCDTISIASSASVPISLETHNGRDHNIDKGFHLMFEVHLVLNNL